MTESWRQETFAKNYRVLLAHGVSRSEAGRLAAAAVGESSTTIRRPEGVTHHDKGGK